jgi:putative inorganic carbon (HCO3(-)) transporter
VSEAAPQAAESSGRDTSDFSQRRRRRHMLPISTGQSVYEWAAIVCLLASSVGGMWLFGGVRIWLYTPLLVVTLLGVALCALRPVFFREIEGAQFPPGLWTFALFIVWAGALIFTAAVPHAARVEWIPMAVLPLVYWAWTELASHQHRWRWLLFILIMSATFMVLYALIQEARGSRLVLTMERMPGYGDRASGAYFCPNHFANLIGILFPICLALMLCRSAGSLLRMLSAYALAVMLPALYLSQSRSGWIGVMAGAAVTLCARAWRHSRRRFALMLALAPAAVAAIGFAAYAGLPLVKQRVDNALAGNMRVDLWRDTLLMIEDRPWTGFGPGSYRWVYAQYNEYMRSFLNWEYAHNEILHTVAEYGLVGLASIAAAILVALIRLLPFLQRAERERDADLIAGLLGSLAACLAHGFFDFNFHIYANNHTLMAVAGIVVAALFGSGDLRPRALPPAVRWTGAAFAVAAALALSFASVQSLLSDRWFRKGESARDEFSYAKAAEFYRRAIRLDPDYWRPYVGMGNLLQRQSFWSRDPETRKVQADEALRFYREAELRNPFDPDPAYGRSRLYHKQGRIEESIAELRRIVESDKRHAFYLVELGRRLTDAGRDAEALDAFERAQAIEPSEMAAWYIANLKQRRTVTSDR